MVSLTCVIVVQLELFHAPYSPDMDQEFLVIHREIIETILNLLTLFKETASASVSFYKDNAHLLGIFLLDIVHVHVTLLNVVLHSKPNTAGNIVPVDISNHSATCQTDSEDLQEVSAMAMRSLRRRRRPKAKEKACGGVTVRDDTVMPLSSCESCSGNSEDDHSCSRDENARRRRKNTKRKLRKKARRLRRKRKTAISRWKPPDSKIDLHGMTVNDAMCAFWTFYQWHTENYDNNGYKEDDRYIVVVTGYGKNSPDNVAKIKPELQKNLNECSIRHVWRNRGGEVVIILDNPLQYESDECDSDFLTEYMNYTVECDNDISGFDFSSDENEETDYILYRRSRRNMKQ